jgi:hypothetical protein
MDYRLYSWNNRKKYEGIGMGNESGNVAQYRYRHPICFMGVYCRVNLAFTLIVLLRFNSNITEKTLSLKGR